MKGPEMTLVKIAARITDTIERHHLALDVLVMLALVFIGAGQIR